MTCKSGNELYGLVGAPGLQGLMVVLMGMVVREGGRGLPFK